MTLMLTLLNVNDNGKTLSSHSMRTLPESTNLTFGQEINTVSKKKSQQKIVQSPTWPCCVLFFFKGRTSGCVEDYSELSKTPACQIGAVKLYTVHPNVLNPPPTPPPRAHAAVRSEICSS